MAPPKVIGIISIKGGVGKTTTVSNLGAVLANEFDQKVLLVDANYSAPNLGLHMGVVNPEKTLHDVLNDKVKINNAIIDHEHGFSLLPASLVPKKINPFKLKNRLDPIREDYDVILIDSSPALNEEILSTMVASDELLVVSSPDYPTLSCTMHAIKVAKQKGTPIAGLVLNKVRGMNYELSLDDVEEATGVPVLAILNDEEKVLEALAHTKPAVLHVPKKDISIEYKKLAASLIGQTFKDKRLKSKIKSFLFDSDIDKADVNRALIEDRRNYKLN
ncbi:AAA family ATPase [Nanoarchaeota archaeon]